MQLLVLSDLHIRADSDPVYFALIRVIRDQAQPGDIVVLAGDIFDLFVGGKRLFLKRYAEFVEAVRHALAKGVRIHYIEGNHDFQLRRAFKDLQNFEVHPHHMTLDLAGKRFLIEHGDTVDRTDYGYLTLRTIFRSLPLRALIRAVPGEVVDVIGKNFSKLSQKTKPRVPTHLPILRMERVRKVFRSYAAEKLTQGFDFVIMGHCHDLDEMRFQIDGRSGHYMNVGYPRNHRSFVYWETGEKELTRKPLV